MAIMAFDRQISSITLTGSVLSSVATFCVLCCFVVFRNNQRTFRHALVLNLALSDFINATTNVVSGSIYMRDHKLVDSPACVANGWIEQLSVQATDFNILWISIATVLVVTQKARLGTITTTRKILICLSSWAIPLITSTTATALGEMKPVSGNWCWISQKRTDLRYSLTHGWRFAIIAITIVAYSYVWWYLRRHFKALWSFSIPALKSQEKGEHTDGSRNYIEIHEEQHTVTLHSMGAQSKSQTEAQAGSSSTNQGIEICTEFTMTENDPRALDEEYGYRQASENSFPDPAVRDGLTCSASTAGPSFATTMTAEPGKEYRRNQTRQRYKEIKRMLLLNGYPLLYVILWIPGIINRVFEATGSTTNSRVLAILQCSTQFIGFSNAITYGLNQQWRAGR
jgi:hypothetical protein